uniref:Uncharacterized protein n=1 Tax=Panagrolaimus davidi TaxID=227884 RepID=A0A914QX52_9BILA
MLVKKEEISSPLPIYTKEDFLNYGNRLHINIIIDIIVNGFAAYIVLKHSTKTMGIYKYYILSTIVCAFLLDFHLTVIYGPLALIPTPVTCSAGVVARNFNAFWGNAIQWATIQSLFAITGGSIMCGFFYQWASLQGNVEFFHSIKGVIILISASILYPLPSITLFFISYDHEGSKVYVKEEYPQFYDLYISVPCSATKTNLLGASQFLAIIVEVLAIFIVGIIIARKIGKKIDSMKHMLSPSTLKARKQLLISLACQAIIPSGLLVAPVIMLFVGILLEIAQLNVMSQLIVPMIAFHSTANALSIIYVITPYRKAVIRGFKTIVGIKSETKTIIINSTVIL